MSVSTLLKLETKQVPKWYLVSLEKNVVNIKEYSKEELMDLAQKHIDELKSIDKEYKGRNLLNENWLQGLIEDSIEITKYGELACGWTNVIGGTVYGIIDGTLNESTIEPTSPFYRCTSCGTKWLSSEDVCPNYDYPIMVESCCLACCTSIRMDGCNH